jgi:alpha-tubulin suppressor-like RCC1 family protein
MHAGVSACVTSPPMHAGFSATAISLGLYHTCAIEAGGGVKCWGYNYYGQLGIGIALQQISPVALPGAG